VEFVGTELARGQQSSSLPKGKENELQIVHHELIQKAVSTLFQ